MRARPFDAGDKIVVVTGEHAAKRGTVIERRYACDGCKLLVQTEPAVVYMGFVLGERFVVDPLRCKPDDRKEAPAAAP